MGLDVYVGPLTRYYSGNWQTIVQQIAPELGAAVNVIRSNEPKDAIKDPEQIKSIVLDWRKQLSESLHDHIKTPLDWTEQPDATYFTDKPAWDCYSDLLLWAAYNEHPNLKRPEKCIDDWKADAAFQASTKKGFKSRYSQLLNGTEMWLPEAFAFTFRAPNASGVEIGFGSSVSLNQQLRDLNVRTWKADIKTLNQWRHDNAEYGAPLEEGARFAFAIFYELSELSVKHRLPMLLDY